METSTTAVVGDDVSVAPAHIEAPWSGALHPWRVKSLRVFRGHVHRLIALGVAESVVVVAAFYLAMVSRFPGEPLLTIDALHGPAWVRAAVAAFVTLTCLAAMGLYALRFRAGAAGMIVRLLIALLMAQAALGFISYIVPPLFVGRGVLALTAVFATLGLLIVRTMFFLLVDQDVFKRRVLIWGSGQHAAEISRMLRRRCDRRGFRIMGYVPTAPEPAVPVHDVVSSDIGLMDFIVRHRVEEIVVAMDDRRVAFPELFLRKCRLQGISVRDSVRFLERESGSLNMDLLKPSCLIFSEGFRCDLLGTIGKRIFDIAAALFIGILGLPLAILAAMAIVMEDRGPTLYGQMRVGQHGRPFRMLKFRSMSVAAELDGKPVWAAVNDPRVTRVGAFIRRTRIDELPQIWNVLMGQMSFVGPRPERPEFVEQLIRTIPFYSERHYVKPGITGWAQVRFPYGASESDARKKLGYDLYYVTHHNLAFDIMVLLLTVEVVLIRIGSR